MDSVKVAFASVALTHVELYGDAYLKQQDRLKESILKIYPEADLFFWKDEYPRGSRSFFDSLYGMKPHAVRVAWDAGFTKVLWLDPAMIMITPIDDLLKFPLFVVEDESKLCNMISDICYRYYHLKYNDVKAKDWRLVGGSLYYFDFSVQKTQDIFMQWLDAEKKGLFGSQQQAASEQINGHRYDETLMALSIYLNGEKPTHGKEGRYCTTVNPMFTKIHFK